MKSVTEPQEKVYDIFDKMYIVSQGMNQITCEVDKTGTLSIALQSMLGKIYRYQPCSATDLARIYSIDQKNTIKYIRELEKRGYVKKETKDRRKLVSLTEEGQRINHELLTMKGRLLDRIVEEVGEDNIEIVNHVFAQMIEVIEGFKDEL